MGDTAESQPADGLLPTERPAAEQHSAASLDTPASSEPSGVAEAGQPRQPAPHHAASGSSLDSSSELGADTFSLLFPAPRPASPPTPAAAPDGESAASAAHGERFLPTTDGLSPNAPDAPAEARNLASGAPPDGDTDGAPVGWTRLTHPLSALDIETQRLGSARPALETETQRLARPRPAIEVETQRISLARQSGDTEAERRAPARPAVEAESRRPLPRDDVTDAETFRLPPREGVADAETLRLAPATPTLEATAEGLSPGGLDGGSSYALPLPITPETLSAAHSSEWSAEDEAAVEDALQKEASAALAALSVMFGAKPAAPGAAPDIPDAPDGSLSPAADEPGDGTLAVVQALRVEIKARPRLRDRALPLLTQPTVAIMALFAVAQMAALSLWRVRVPPDEIASLQVALRMVQGYSASGGFQALTHLLGASLWLAVASVGYLIGGLAGAQVIAIICVAACGLATASAAKNLFGQIAGLFTAAVFALSGPVIYLAHLAVPDQLALVGVAVSFWALTQASASRQRKWLLVAACACGVGMIAWLPALLCLISLIGVALALRGRPVFTGLYLAGLLVVAIVVSRAFPAHESVLAVIPQRSRAGLSLSLSVSGTGLELLYDGAVVWALAIAGWVVARWRGWLAAALVTGMFVWPVYLALAGVSVDTERRLVFGFVFGLPLAGAALAALWSAHYRISGMRGALAAIVLLALGMVGIIQARALDDGSGAVVPHAVHMVVGKTDGGVLPPLPSGHAARDMALVAWRS